MADDVVISIRSRGGRTAARDIDRTTASVTRLGRAGRTAGSGLQTLGRNTSAAAGRGLGYVGDRARYAGGGLLALGAASSFMGLKFNASMEQNQIAFTQFLGSSAAARKEIGFLYDLAKVTPFQFTDVTLATRKFLAFGFGVKEANSLLKTVADTASGLALDDSGIDRMVLAIGQIRSKGTLQMEDLRQLQELGAVNIGQLGKDLGLTREQMANVGAEAVPSRKALRALKKQWDHTFGGMSAKQAKSFNGQLSTLKDNVNQTLGTLSKPAFNALRKKVFPALNAGAEEINSIFGRDDLDLGEKLTLSRRALKRNLGPLADAVQDEVEELHIGQWLSGQVEEQTPVVLNAVGTLGKKATGAFIDGWLHAGFWGKLMSVGFLGAKLGLIGPAAGSVFGWAGGKAAGQFKSAWRKRLGKLPAPVSIGGAATTGVIEGAAGAGTAAAAGRGATAGGAARIIGKVAKVGGPLAALGITADALINADEAGATGRSERELLASAVRERRADRRGKRRGRAAAPHQQRSPTYVLIDGELVAAKIVSRHGRTLERGTRRAREDREARR